MSTPPVQPRPSPQQLASPLALEGCSSDVSRSSMDEVSFHMGTDSAPVETAAAADPRQISMTCSSPYSQVSAPSSPFMELIYSASGSTTTADAMEAAASPGSSIPHGETIFRTEQEEEETPIRTNNTRMKSTGGVTTTTNDDSLQSMQGDEEEDRKKHPPNNATYETSSHPPQLQGDNSGVPATWVIPRIQTATSHEADVTPPSQTTSPFSLPSMLGTLTQESSSQEEQDNISELESPMFFSTTTEASDIQSQSQATDIQSWRTLTPQNNISAPVKENEVSYSEDEEEPEVQEYDAVTYRLPGPLVRCNAQDELDEAATAMISSADEDTESSSQPWMTDGNSSKLQPSLKLMASNSGFLVSRLDVINADAYTEGGESDSQSHDVSEDPSMIMAMNPSLNFLARNSGFLLSRGDVVDAAYTEEDESSASRDRILADDPSIRRLQRHHQQDVAAETAATTTKHQTVQIQPSPRTFFRSPRTVQYDQMQDDDDGIISELSSQLEGGDIEQGGGGGVGKDDLGIAATASSPTSSKEVTDDDDDDDSSNNNRTLVARSIFASSRLGMICRLCIVTVLALCVIVPLVIVLLYYSSQDDDNDASNRSSANTNNEVWNRTITTWTPSMAPVLPPTTLTTTLAPSATTITLAPSSSSSMTMTTLNPTMAPTAAVVTSVPSKAPVVTTIPVDTATASPSKAPVTAEPVDATMAPSKAPITTEPVDTASPTQVATTARVTMSPTVAPSVVVLATTSPTATPTLSPSTSQPTTSPTMVAATTVSSPAPQAAGPPTLPPYAVVWEETTWIEQEGASNRPLWPRRNDGSSSLELTILNSLTDTSHSSILEETLQEWSQSTSILLPVLSDPISTLEIPLTSVDECIPTLGAIRVCNGNFGTAMTSSRSRFRSDVYVNDQDEILAAVILQNDDFGLESLLSETTLTYNYCHELGHALGLFHSSVGCMIETIPLDQPIASFLRPDPAQRATLKTLYGQLEAP